MHIFSIGTLFRHRSTGIPCLTGRHRCLLQAGISSPEPIMYRPQRRSLQTPNTQSLTRTRLLTRSKPHPLARWIGSPWVKGLGGRQIRVGGGGGVKWCRLPLPHSERSGVKLQVQRVGGLWPRLSIAQSDGEEDSGNCRSTERTGGQVGRHGRTDTRTDGQPDGRTAGQPDGRTDSHR